MKIDVWKFWLQVLLQQQKRKKYINKIKLRKLTVRNVFNWIHKFGYLFKIYSHSVEYKIYHFILVVVKLIIQERDKKILQLLHISHFTDQWIRCYSVLKIKETLNAMTDDQIYEIFFVNYNIHIIINVQSLALQDLDLQ